MKRIVLGDVHGHIDYVTSIIEKESTDEVILLGDYFDSFTVKPEDQMECFKKLISLQDQFGKDKFHMIIGNHDFHYFCISSERYSGFNMQYYPAYRSLLEQALQEKRLQYIYVDRGTIYSHAGVTETWLKQRCDCELENVNELGERFFIFTTLNGGDHYGSSNMSSCIWVRPDTLLGYNLPGYDQVVGHTYTKIPIYEEVLNEGKKEKFYIIDCLPNGYVREIIEDNKITRKIIQVPNDKIKLERQ